MHTVNYLFGHCEVFEIPCEAIFPCSASGDVSEEVTAYAKKCEGNWPTREIIVTELKESGAWEDLDTAELHILQERFLWIACCNVAEEME